MIEIHGNDIYKKIRSRNDILFILLAGSSEISKIPGISAAGVTPEMTEMTPVLDSEIIQSGKCKSYDVIPMTAEGIPTPAIITRACNELSGIDTIIIDSGFAKSPSVPFIYTGLGPAEDFTEKTALPEYQSALEYGRYIGSMLDGKYRFIFLAESVPGGTTTAYAVLHAAGHNQMTSSSLKNNPEELKNDIINRAFRRHSVNGLTDAVIEYGDYMMALSLGISSKIEKSTVIFSGGTQMGNVYMLDKEINKTKNRYVFTTGYVMDDKKELMLDLCGDNLIYSKVDFNGIDGLNYYDLGYVREGAGFGAALGISISLGIKEDDIYKSIKSVYKSFLK